VPDIDDDRDRHGKAADLLFLKRAPLALVREFGCASLTGRSARPAPVTNTTVIDIWPRRPATGQGRAAQRSPGRRPTIHHATGNKPAATSSFNASHTRNGISPASIAAPSVMLRLAISHGTPIA
jgi:hypothetical protein